MPTQCFPGKDGPQGPTHRMLNFYQRRELPREEEVSSEENKSPFELVEDLSFSEEGGIAGRPSIITNQICMKETRNQGIMFKNANNN